MKETLSKQAGSSWRGVVVESVPDLTIDEVLRALLALNASRRVAVLDSGGKRGAEARFFIAGFDPFETVEARQDELHISWREQGATPHYNFRTERGSVLALLDDRLARYRIRPAPTDSTSSGHRSLTLPATGACIATFSYDLARTFERLRVRAPHASSTGMVEPDAVLAFYDTLVIHDYLRHETYVASMGGDERLAETLATLHEARPAASGLKADIKMAAGPLVTSNFTRAEYTAAVRLIKEHILAGDIYQANLTQAITCQLHHEARAEDIFMRLRREHPASFAAFLRRREDVVISASPERFLRVEVNVDSTIDTERRVEACPIKGTRARGETSAEDARLRHELQTSAKDRAENVMIVDLMRNDLGRVCRFGSVEVVELCALQEHPTLFHLVSKVRGTLRAEVTAGALLRACFPCGSITGAPKIRAMEIIDAVEPVRRGLSMGAIGYFSFDGAIDLNVAIRTMTLPSDVEHGGAMVARFNVGGGIVADSDPDAEYEESLVKARALLRALQAGGVPG